MQALTFTWDGEAFYPLNPKAADRQFVVGMNYRMDIREERSDAAHRHFFASINDAFNNLPERLAEEIPSAEHLRKWALIRAGYCDHRATVFTSAADAVAGAALAKPLDDYAVVSVRECTVHVFTAKSQSVAAMGKEEFAASKKAVLDIISKLIGTDAGTLRNNTEKAA